MVFLPTVALCSNRNDILQGTDDPFVRIFFSLLACCSEPCLTTTSLQVNMDGGGFYGITYHLLRRHLRIKLVLQMDLFINAYLLILWLIKYV